ncbi:hypothetical protein ACJX0J_015066, partial [Zea mays]
MHNICYGLVPFRVYATAVLDVALAKAQHCYFNLTVSIAKELEDLKLKNQIKAQYVCATWACLTKTLLALLFIQIK